MKIPDINSTKSRSTILVVFAVLLLVLLASNIVGIIFNCIHATDFSIYQQGIYQIAKNLDLNPYVTNRGLHIFSDHFDPIIFLAAPWVKVFNYHPISLVLFEFGIFLLFLFLLFRESYKFSLS